MRTIKVITDASCRVSETWMIEVPDNFPVGTYEDEPDLFLDLLDHAEQFESVIIDVTESVYDEADREVQLWEITG